MAPVNANNKTKSSRVSAAKALPHRVTKRPARGFHRFRNGILNVVPKGAEKDIVKMNRSSSLLRLPTEIRQEIWKYNWKYVLEGKTYLATCFSGRHYRESYRFAPSTVEAPNGTALLRTCRQIYSEAVLFPFFMATFAYHNLTYLKRSVKTLQAYQRKHATHLRIDCRRRSPTLYVEDSGLLSDKIDVIKIFPALTRITVLVHDIIDADDGFDYEPYVAKVDNLPPRLRRIIKTEGTSLDVANTHDLLESRDVDEMDKVDGEDEEDEEDEEGEEN
ncbi:hypothetical protein E8E12_011070 [Didymella heteroderae]|uniref:DUF7730 domain-containing protein n=1 Tax=Didymella heteroderae TaxID=1769908 RepID=A0A9P4X027_9PLEO|nr:hypothetical protein E8E12_011070 [Didymella heteroderae]